MEKQRSENDRNRAIGKSDKKVVTSENTREERRGKSDSYQKIAYKGQQIMTN